MESKKKKISLSYQRRGFRRARLDGKIKFIHGDFFKHNVSKANVIILFLNSILANELGPKLVKELRSGTRIVTHDTTLVGWKAVGLELVSNPPNTRSLLRVHVIKLYRVPESFPSKHTR